MTSFQELFASRGQHALGQIPYSNLESDLDPTKGSASFTPVLVLFRVTSFLEYLMLLTHFIARFYKVDIETVTLKPARSHCLLIKTSAFQFQFP